MVAHSGGSTASTHGVSWVLCLERIYRRAYHMFLVRIAEALFAWGILEFFYAAAVPHLWLTRLVFGLYLLVNALLVIPQRRRAMTPLLVWVDVIANLAPMAVATHWSGGLSSPLLPIFVIKIGNYGLVYSLATGIRAAIATVVMLGTFAMTGYFGLGPTAQLHLVPESTRQRLTLSFGSFLFLVGSYGAVRFFRELSEREHQLGVALAEQRLLYAQSLKDRERLRQLSQRLVDVSEATMQAVSRELHDDLGQAITAVRMDLGHLERELGQHPSLQERVRDVRHQLGTILENVRNLSQMLRPAVLDDLGLVAAFESYATRFAERTGIHVDLHLPTAEPNLVHEVRVALYRALQEALTNVARHAAASRVLIALEQEADRVRLHVRDNGRGFTPEGDTTPAKSLGRGIAGMRERAELYGGRFSITSSPGHGTAVSMEMPITFPGEGTRGKEGVNAHYCAAG